MKKNFKAPWSTELILITSFTIILFLVLPFILFLHVDEKNPDLLTYAWIALAVCVGILALAAWVSLIRGYAISGDSLIIRRPGKDLRFSLTNLRSIEKDPNAMRRTYVMPNGGLFSFGGKRCKNKRLGIYQAYATHKKQCVVLRFPGSILVVSPDDPDGFAKTIQETFIHTD